MGNRRRIIKDRMKAAEIKCKRVEFSNLIKAGPYEVSNICQHRLVCVPTGKFTLVPPRASNSRRLVVSR